MDATDPYSFSKSTSRYSSHRPNRLEPMRDAEAASRNLHGDLTHGSAGNYHDDREDECDREDSSGGSEDRLEKEVVDRDDAPKAPRLGSRTRMTSKWRLVRSAESEPAHELSELDHLRHSQDSTPVRKSDALRAGKGGSNYRIPKGLRRVRRGSQDGVASVGSSSTQQEEFGGKDMLLDAQQHAHERRDSSVSSGSLAGLRSMVGESRRRLKLMSWKSFSNSSRSLPSVETDEVERYRHEECALCSFEVQDPTLGPCGHIFCRHCAWDRIIEGPASCPMCGEHLSSTTMTQVAQHCTLEPNPACGIFDSVFVEYGRIGFKSFHFSRDACYIDYSATDGPEEWKYFDDGSPAPSKKHFDSFSYDETHRVFHGTVIWSPKTRSGGIAKVNYELVFDETFEQICGGTAVAFKTEGTVHGVLHYGSQARYRRLKSSIYTTDSIYMWDSTRPLLNSNSQRDGWSPYKGLLRFSRWIAKTTMGIPNWMFQELMSDRVGLYGVGSVHFSQSGSFINLANVRGPGLPAFIPFLRESFSEASRTFTADFEFDPYWFSGETSEQHQAQDEDPEDSVAAEQHGLGAHGPMQGLAQCELIFDPELSTVIDGSIRFFQKVRVSSASQDADPKTLVDDASGKVKSRQRSGVFAALMCGVSKKSKLASPPIEVETQQLELMRTVKLGTDIVLRLKNPWQTITHRVYHIPQRVMIGDDDL